MGIETEIAWTDHTFNPWWGCVRVSEGCRFCYAESWDKRYGGKNWGPQAPRRFFGDKHWNEPLRWNRDAEIAGVQRRVFCASMADVFEDRRDLDAQRERLWKLIDATPHLDWQLLTKRPENMTRLAPSSWLNGWPPHVWAGTTAEDQQRADERTRELLKVPAAVRFLSCEPLLGPVTLWSDVEGVLRGPAVIVSGGMTVSTPHEHSEGYDDSQPGIDWVIVGGESGPGARQMRLAWARDLIAQCKSAGVACFTKQLGAAPTTVTLDAAGFPRTTAGGDPWPATLVKLKSRKGGDMEEWPADLRVREFPEAAQ